MSWVLNKVDSRCVEMKSRKARIWWARDLGSYTELASS